MTDTKRARRSARVNTEEGAGGRAAGAAGAAGEGEWVLPPDIVTLLLDHIMRSKDLFYDEVGRGGSSLGR